MVTRLDEKPYYKGEAIPEGAFTSYGHYSECNVVCETLFDCATESNWHLTAQCVWKNSLRYGVATAYDGKGSWYTVGRYAPAGNVYGEKPY